MNSVNKVQLSGNVGKAPEIRIFEGDRKMAKFSLATNESYKNSENEWVTNTQWHTIVAWGKVAQLVEEQIKRGSPIAIEGKLTNTSYTDKTGTKRFYTQVQMNGFEVVQPEPEVAESK